MYFSTLFQLSVAIATAAAQTAGLDPISKPPEGPVTIPANETYTIEWQKTEDALVTLELLAGHNSSTLSVQTPPIAECIENTGSFDWDVSIHLAVADTYGILLTVESGDKAGEFQYSFPFEISGLTPPP